MSLAGLADRMPSCWRGRDLFCSEKPPKAVFGQIGWPNENASLLHRENVKERHERERAYIRYRFARLMRVGVRTRRHRMDLSWMQNGHRIPMDQADGNLFDLQVDPEEKHNLWTDTKSNSVITELVRTLEHWFEGMDKPPEVFGDFLQKRI